MSDFTLPALSKEVATYLTAQFSASFTARHNSQVVYPLDQLSTLRVDVWPSGLTLTKGSRKGLSRLPVLNIALQQRAKDQEKVDLLTNICDEVLTYLLNKRYADGGYYSVDGSFIGTDIFDRFVKYEENVFQSVMEVNFQRVI